VNSAHETGETSSRGKSQIISTAAAGVCVVMSLYDSVTFCRSALIVRDYSVVPVTLWGGGFCCYNALSARAHKVPLYYSLDFDLVQQ